MSISEPPQTKANASSRQENTGAKLKPDSVGLLGTIGMAVGPQAPTGGINLLPAIMASIVGAAATLAFGLGLVAMLFVAYAFVVFSRRINSAGQLYSYTGIALGSAYGAVTGFGWLIAFAAVAGWLSIQDGVYLVAVFRPTGIVLPWLLMSGLMWLVMVLLTFRSIHLSTILVVIVEACGVTLMLVVAGVVIAHGGYAGHSLSWRPFTTNGKPLSVVMVGVVFAFTSFSGFEAAGSLGEEAKRPRWAIPVAIFSALIVSGLIYVFMTWVETVGFASAKDLAQQTTPLVTIASRYIGAPMGTTMNVAALLSGFGAQLACLAAATRVLYALGRDGFTGTVQKRLTITHARFGTPVVPFILTSLLAGIAVFAFAGAGPVGSITDVSSYGADIEVIVYLLVVIAAVAFCWRYDRRVHHIVILVIGVLVMGYVVKDSVYPIPVAPLNYAMYAAFGTFGVGIIALLLFKSLRKRLAKAEVFSRVALNAGDNAREGTDTPKDERTKG